ncbi:MAG: cytochrome b/b6 domain-containing protein [Maritimibacter sp.]|jgi:cytochrome b561
MAQPKGYTRIQIGLHWLMAVLIVAMFLNEDAIGHAYHSLMRDGSFEQSPLVAAHVFGGIAVLVLVVIRLAIKAKRGAPALPENEPPLLKLAAQGAHLGLYGLMLLVPVAGLMAWFGQMGWAAELHEVMTTLLELLAILHVIGALYQHFYLKTDVLNRMRKPE